MGRIWQQRAGIVYPRSYVKCESEDNGFARSFYRTRFIRTITFFIKYGCRRDRRQSGHSIPGVVSGDSIKKGQGKTMKLPVVLERYRLDIDNEIRTIVECHKSSLYDMMRYHLGWIDGN